jgi:hypothetical protein
VLWAVQAFARAGFRSAFHPMSLLALGNWGWGQVVNFVDTGMLAVLGDAETLALRLVNSAGIELGLVSALDFGSVVAPRFSGLLPGWVRRAGPARTAPGPGLPGGR